MPINLMLCPSTKITVKENSRFKRLNNYSWNSHRLAVRCELKFCVLWTREHRHEFDVIAWSSSHEVVIGSYMWLRFERRDYGSPGWLLALHLLIMLVQSFLQLEYIQLFKYHQHSSQEKDAIAAAINKLSNEFPHTRFTCRGATFKTCSCIEQLPSKFDMMELKFLRSTIFWNNATPGVAAGTFGFLEESKLPVQFEGEEN